jgi:hypothetical protein
MTRLRELASLIRSKNAGPFELTFDIMFRTQHDYEAVKKLAAINAELFARMYDIPAELVRVYEYDPAFSIKITIPRVVTSGSLGDSDVYGCQQFGPLVDIDIPGIGAVPREGAAVPREGAAVPRQDGPREQPG